MWGSRQCWSENEGSRRHWVRADDSLQRNVCGLCRKRQNGAAGGYLGAGHELDQNRSRFQRPSNPSFTGPFSVNQNWEYQLQSCHENNDPLSHLFITGFVPCFSSKLPDIQISPRIRWGTESEENSHGSSDLYDIGLCHTTQYSYVRLCVVVDIITTLIFNRNNRPRAWDGRGAFQEAIDRWLPFHARFGPSKPPCSIETPPAAVDPPNHKVRPTTSALRRTLLMFIWHGAFSPFLEVGGGGGSYQPTWQARLP